MSTGATAIASPRANYELDRAHDITSNALKNRRSPQKGKQCSNPSFISILGLGYIVNLSLLIL